MTNHYNIKWLTEKFERGEELKFLYFWGHTNNNNSSIDKSCFSQWYPSPFTVDGIIYKTAEHWMMAHKALLFGDTTSFEKIINCESPKEAKDLGRLVNGYDDQVWNENRFEIVKLGNINKFNQHPALANYLLETGNQIIVEASPVDTVWGIGLTASSKDIDNIYAWRGLNLLGFVLMEVRDFINEFGHFKPLKEVLQPPWKRFPEIEANDMFWRMGAGEDYLIQFSAYINSLNEREKIVYKLTYPFSYGWESFYDE
ncbi:MAG: NADAR family protein [Flavipsychrobacter sp.]|nr:NADAR family protein [Flavipsychrobacter sp.]